MLWIFATAVYPERNYIFFGYQFVSSACKDGRNMVLLINMSLNLAGIYFTLKNVMTQLTK